MGPDLLRPLDSRTHLVLGSIAAMFGLMALGVLLIWVGWDLAGKILVVAAGVGWGAGLGAWSILRMGRQDPWDRP